MVSNVHVDPSVNGSQFDYYKIIKMDHLYHGPGHKSSSHQATRSRLMEPIRNIHQKHCVKWNGKLDLLCSLQTKQTGQVASTHLWRCRSRPKKPSCYLKNVSFFSWPEVPFFLRLEGVRCITSGCAGMAAEGVT